jgi:FlaG/FlaF family flagellin (archaellin)
MKQKHERAEGEDIDTGKAVSTVIGVILMVAITVILATVIGTFVLDLGQNVQEPAQAGITFDYESGGDNLTVTVVDPGNVDALYVQNNDGGITDSDIDARMGWEDNAEDGRAVNNDPDGGDTVVIGGIQNDDDVAVIGAIDGEETLLDAWELE